MCPGLVEVETLCFRLCDGFVMLLDHEGNGLNLEKTHKLPLKNKGKLYNWPNENHFLQQGSPQRKGDKNPSKVFVKGFGLFVIVSSSCFFMVSLFLFDARQSLTVRPWKVVVERRLPFFLLRRWAMLNFRRVYLDWVGEPFFDFTKARKKFTKISRISVWWVGCLGCGEVEVSPR